MHVIVESPFLIDSFVVVIPQREVGTKSRDYLLTFRAWGRDYEDVSSDAFGLPFSEGLGLPYRYLSGSTNTGRMITPKVNLQVGIARLELGLVKWNKSALDLEEPLGPIYVNADIFGGGHTVTLAARMN